MRVLFVDDDQRLLDGLRTLLRKQRTHWTMEFALGGEAALAAIDQAPFDVVVSDMRMPGIDGAELLAQIKHREPRTVRIILSGQTAHADLVRTMAVAHQFLSKPCSADTLRSLLERMRRLRSLLPDPAIRAVIGALDRLPSVPSAHAELEDALARPSVKLAELAAVFARDPASSLKVLQLAHSDYFGQAEPPSSIHGAVGHLGLQTLKELAVSAHVFSTPPTASIEGFSLTTLQQHAIATADLARRLADPAGADAAFTAGLLHDVGLLVLALGFPDRFAEAVRTVQSTGEPQDRVEQQMFGFSHAEIGGYLLGIWGLPMTIVDAVAHHHAPARLAEGALATLAVVHVATALVDGRPDRIDTGFLEAAGLAERLPRWREIADAPTDPAQAP